MSTRRFEIRARLAFLLRQINGAGPYRTRLARVYEHASSATVFPNAQIISDDETEEVGTFRRVLSTVDFTLRLYSGKFVDGAALQEIDELVGDVRTVLGQDRSLGLEEYGVQARVRDCFIARGLEGEARGFAELTVRVLYRFHHGEP